MLPPLFSGLVRAQVLGTVWSRRLGWESLKEGEREVE